MKGKKLANEFTEPSQGPQMGLREQDWADLEFNNSDFIFVIRITFFPEALDL